MREWPTGIIIVVNLIIFSVIIGLASQLGVMSKSITRTQEENNRQVMVQKEYRELNKYMGNVMGGQDVIAAILHFKGTPNVILEDINGNIVKRYDNNTPSSELVAASLMSSISDKDKYLARIEYDGNDVVSNIVFTRQG